ncbi:MAG: response regulator [Candidatus Omnitrophica bacterium]|nr:response regulator [Candidatus Omnitrophota bacterium]
MNKKKKTRAIEEERKRALHDLLIALALLMAFTVLNIAISLLRGFYAFVTAYYSPPTTETLISLAFLLMFVLSWLTYRRWRESSQIITELEGIISNINPDVLLVVDPDRTITRCNSSIEKVFGYEVDEVLGQKTSLLYGDRRVNKTQHHEIYDVLERQGFHIGEAMGKRKDGTLIHIEVITGKLASRTGAVVLLRDISVRKRLEAELLQSQKLEAIGRLAGGVAHDFNNLITVIAGFAKLIRKRTVSSDPWRPDLEEILKATERATGLTQQLLAFGRGQILNLKVVNLNEVISNINKLLCRLIGEDVELVTIPEENLGYVKVDVTQIEQVLFNLTLNARDAMPKGGKIVIKTSNTKLDSKDYVAFEVIDNGMGMTEEAKKHLFEPFFTTRQERSGVGLGLATCYGIIKQNQGQIFVSSQPNQGTTFNVCLPRVEAPKEKPEEPKEPEELPRGSESVLLVEDEPMVRELAGRVLRDQGYQVIEAANGPEALKLLEKNPKMDTRLLLTDVVMPLMGGLELAQKFRDLRPELRVLFMSGYIDDARVRYGVLDERVEFLPKPFSPESLAVKVREVLDR